MNITFRGAALTGSSHSRLGKPDELIELMNRTQDIAAMLDGEVFARRVNEPHGDFRHCIGVATETDAKALQYLRLICEALDQPEDLRSPLEELFMLLQKQPHPEARKHAERIGSFLNMVEESPSDWNEKKQKALFTEVKQLSRYFGGLAYRTAMRPAIA